GAPAERGLEGPLQSPAKQSKQQGNPRSRYQLQESLKRATLARSWCLPEVRAAWLLSIAKISGKVQQVDGQPSMWTWDRHPAHGRRGYPRLVDRCRSWQFQSNWLLETFAHHKSK